MFQGILQPVKRPHLRTHQQGRLWAKPTSSSSTTTPFRAAQTSSCNVASSLQPVPLKELHILVGEAPEQLSDELLTREWLRGHTLPKHY